MNAEGTKVLEKGKHIFDGHENHPTVEGPKVYKRNGFYYIFAPAGGVATGWQLVLRSKNIYGPYDEKIVLEQGKSTVNGPHQGAWVDTKNGEDWFYHFQDVDTYGRIVHLQPMKWINDWPFIGVDQDKNGIGEPVLTYKKPTISNKSDIINPSETDEFKENDIGLQWQWSANPSIVWYSKLANQNFLRLFSIKVPENSNNLWTVPNLLTQKFPAPNFTATTKVKLTPEDATEGKTAGLLIMGTDYQSLVITNKKDGYYFHVTNSNREQVPEHFYRKATLKNSERYGTEALARLESQMLDARENSASLEYDLFLQVRSQTETFIARIQKLAKTIAEIDVLQSLAVVAENNHYIQPDIIKNGQEIQIINGRHAVVEKVMGAQEYVPNSIEFDAETMIQLITGPNMSGKSTYMRELALTVVMTQIGSFVPAEQVQLSIFDAIFTRIGAADDLISGQSTFMVEMMEANHAIRRATKNSLILFDELGRGTATYDGIALAQAIVEHIHEQVGAKTLFATHYHELVTLENSLQHLKNVHVATLEANGEVTFLHKIESGPADKSYGIHVAKIAGLPSPLLKRAKVILSELEADTPKLPVETIAQESPTDTQQLDLFAGSDELADAIRNIDIMNLTPMEAMNKLFELKKLV